MNTEVIILYIFQAILGILGPFIVYLPVKYLNQKALGMQTVFDQMMKDFLYSIILKSISLFPIMALIMEFLLPLNHYLAIVIASLAHFLTLMIFWQYSALIGVRYLSVFHPTYLSNENLIKIITRCSISFISLLSILSSDLENTINILSGKKPNSRKHFAKPVIVTIGMSVIAQIIIQYKLEKFKKTVDSRRFDESHQRSCEYGTSFYTHRLEFCIMACPFLFTLYLLYLVPKDIYTSRLILVIFFQIIFLIALPGVFFYKNDNMRSFISKLFGMRDVSKKYIVPENRRQDTLDSTIVVNKDDTNYIAELHVIKKDRTHENSDPDLNIKDSHVTHIFHCNEDHNTITNIEDPIPGCSHW